MVLKGMVDSLPVIDALVVEVSTLSTLKDGPELAEVVTWLAAHGFVVADILATRTRPLDGVLAQLDMLFVPAKATFRQDRRWEDE
jgi:hypothetical protein